MQQNPNFRYYEYQSNKIKFSTLSRSPTPEPIQKSSFSGSEPGTSSSTTHSANRWATDIVIYISNKRIDWLYSFDYTEDVFPIANK